MSRVPCIPLHPELRAYALALLRDRMTLIQIQQHARVWALEQWGPVSGDAYFCYVLMDHESTSFYWSICKEIGIPQRSSPQDNMHGWFGPGEKPPSTLFTQSCLSYEAYEEGVTNRFSIIISTPEMQEKAWQFGHGKQMLMDLTFGFCSGRLLLCILMAINDRNKGIPIAFILFTA